VAGAMRLRSWNATTDVRAVQQLASRLWPRGPHPGGLGWDAATGQMPGTLIIADENGVRGWAGLTGGELVLHADPANPEAARLLIEWAEQEGGPAGLRVTVYDGDEVARRAVMQAGFSLDHGAGPATGMFRAASAEGPALPEGYRIRSVRAGEFDARVQVHRAAWRPMTLPWPGEVPAVVSASTTSSFTARHYQQVRSTWLYEQDRDLVVEAPDGTLAACCIAWWDAAHGCAEIEPLGVLPEHRRKGLASAMCMEVAARVAVLGGTQVFINTGPRPDYPAPAATYLTVGFEVASRGRRYCRQLS
jgi:GNAT superfamily N-acetyltransferase